jgi:tellurite resistance protein TerC
MVEQSQNLRKSLIGVLIFVGSAAIFGIGIWLVLGAAKALEYFGGYLIEFSLSLDNMFVFLSIFIANGVALKAQHKALNYGIAGAVVLRFLFIFFGLQLISRFGWLLYVFGVILIVSGSLMFKEEKEATPKDSKIMDVIRKRLRFTSDYVEEKLFVRLDKKLFVTPLFAVIILIEFSDIIFALDSVPAIFSITTDLLIVYTSNIFAILGLRQLYFVIQHLHARFAYVKYGVGLLLIFTGLKLGGGLFHLHIDNLLSILIILFIITSSIIISMIVSGRKKKDANP